MLKIVKNILNLTGCEKKILIIRFRYIKKTFGALLYVTRTSESLNVYKPSGNTDKMENCRFQLKRTCPLGLLLLDVAACCLLLLLLLVLLLLLLLLAWKFNGICISLEFKASPSGSRLDRAGCKSRWETLSQSSEVNQENDDFGPIVYITIFTWFQRNKSRWIACASEVEGFSLLMHQGISFTGSLW